MALRINLYHEVLRAKRQKQYDPLKLSIYALVAVALGMLAYYFVQMKRTSDARSAYSASKAEFDKLTPKQKEAETQEAELNKQIDTADKLTKRMEKRVYWAPLFEMLVVTVPPNVQLTRLACDSGRDKGGTSSMNLEGIAADTEPRALAENFRKTILARFGAKYPGATASFRSLDDGTEHPVVNGKRVPSVVFTISMTFKTEPDPAPAPAPKKQIAKNDSPTP